MVTIVIVDLGRHEESRMIVIVDRGRHEELLTVVFVDRGRATRSFVKDTQLRSDRDRRSARSKRINAIVVGDRQIKDPTALKNPIVIVDLTDRIKYPNKVGSEETAPRNPKLTPCSEITWACMGRV